MKFPKLSLINRNQRGFTLMEMVVAMALTGVITGAITSTIFQVINTSSSTSNHMIAVRHAQEAGFQVSCDVQQARVVTPEADPDGFPLVLTWTDWSGTTSTVQYKIEGTELQRKVDDGHWGRIAQYINTDPTQTYCDFTDGKFTFQVTVTVGSGSEVQKETRLYEVVPRPGS